MNMFKLAVKHESKLRLAIAGPSGSGKTYTGLAIATHLANGGKVAVVDTEHGSASKYADLFHFDALEIVAPFHPDKFIAAIDAAQKAGYDVLVIDSLSHAWNGPGGVLELKEQFARQKGYNDYTAWGPAGDIQNNFVQAILSAKIHIIATMRSKMEYAVEEYEEQGRKKTRIRKVGMAPIQRNDTEYEFDIVLDMDIENYATVSKTRCSELTGKVIKQPGKDLANTLRSWLSGEPMPITAPVTRQPAPLPPVKAVPPGVHRETGEVLMPNEIPMFRRGDYEQHISLAQVADSPITIDPVKWELFRGKVSSNPRNTVSSVCSAVAATGVYRAQDHALNAARLLHPDLEKSTQLSQSEAVVLFDQLIARKQADQTPLFADEQDKATGYAE